MVRNENFQLEELTERVREGRTDFSHIHLPPGALDEVKDYPPMQVYLKGAKWDHQNGKHDERLIFDDSELAYIKARELHLPYCSARRAVFNRSDLTCATLTHADLTEASFQRTILQRANLSYAILASANLAEADLSNTDLSYAVLDGSTINDALLHYANCTAASFQDVKLRRAKGLTTATFEGANLSGMDFSGMDLTHAKLARANLSRANFEGAKLRKADLTDANLRGAYFVDAELGGAEMAHVNLDGANLCNSSGLLQAIGIATARITASTKMNDRERTALHEIRPTTRH